MAISYTIQGAIAGESTFIARLTQAVMDSALDISGETQGGSTAEEWAARQALAHQVLGNGSANQFVRPVIANIGSGASVATDGSEGQISDAEIDTAVAAVWNDVAGIAAS